MKLWDKGIETDKKVELFTIGHDNELDLKLARFDVLGTIAHITMLESIGLLAADELRILHAELKNIYAEIEAGRFEIEPGIEDVHSQVELMLTRKLGDVGKKVHSGRSRNDQVLVDLKLFMRHELIEITFLVKELFDTLISLSDKYKTVLLPGYTHLQVAMPSSFGLWFGAYAESLADDVLMLQSAYRICNQNPLGSAAGYGSSFPLNRTLTTQLLGFETLNFNVVYAQMGRGKTERTVAYALGTLGATLSKMAMDVCLYTSQNFGFVSFPDNLTTGSSIMPHKKNPDVFELIRGKGNKLQALANEITLMTANLPSGYHRDLQLLKESLFPALEDCKSSLSMATMMLHHMKINEDLINDPKYDYLFSVEVVNKLVLDGMPFRDAYKKVTTDIQQGNFKPSRDINHTHEGSIGNLCNEHIVDKMNYHLFGINVKQVDKAFENLLD